MAQTRERPGRGDPGHLMVYATTTASVPEPTNSLPCARAYGGPPVPGRQLWAVTVLTCPVCRAMHQHRVGEAARLLAGRVVRVCPVWGRPYRLRPVQRRKEAVRRAGA